MTGEEFKLHLEQIIENGKRLQENYKGREEGFKDGFVLSLDRLQAHRAVLRELGLKEDEEFILVPPKSFDMQKPVEHAHSMIKGRFGKEMNYIAPRATRKRLLGALEACVHHAITRSSLMRDIDSLPATYEAIIEAQGDYPAAEFR
jgi:hypothetical protein